MTAVRGLGFAAAALRVCGGAAARWCGGVVVQGRDCARLEVKRRGRAAGGCGGAWRRDGGVRAAVESSGVRVQAVEREEYLMCGAHKRISDTVRWKVRTQN